MQIEVTSSLARLRRFVRKLGPYVVLEILLPGGTLLALLLFLVRRRKLNAGSNAPRTAPAVTRALASVLEQAIFVPQPYYARTSHAVHHRVRDRLESNEARHSGVIRAASGAHISAQAAAAS